MTIQPDELGKEVNCQRDVFEKNLIEPDDPETNLIRQQRESGNAMTHRISSHFLSLRPPIVDEVRAKWSKRRLKESSLDQDSASDFGLKRGFSSEKLRGFRWAKTRM